MGIPAIVSQHYAVLLPVGLVILCVVLVFIFGFKSSVEPPTLKQLGLLADEKKSGKKRKAKDKKSHSNGHASTVSDNTGTKKDQSAKALKQSNKNEPAKGKKSEDHVKVKDKKQESIKSPPKQEKKQAKKSKKENVEMKPAKPAKPAKNKEEKPSDYDEGKWETATSRKDRKNKKKEDAAPPASIGKASDKKPNKKEPEKKQDNAVQNPKSSKSPKNKEAKKNPTGKQIETVAAKGGGKENQPAKKTPKKKGNENVPQAKENAGAKQPKTSTPAKKPATPKNADKKESELLKEKNNMPEPQIVAEYDDAGDWKEAPHKKNRKRVRKE